jgi:hypothetical protein
MLHGQLQQGIAIACVCNLWFLVLAALLVFSTAATGAGVVTAGLDDLDS